MDRVAEGFSLLNSRRPVLSRHSEQSTVMGQVADCYNDHPVRTSGLTSSTPERFLAMPIPKLPILLASPNRLCRLYCLLQMLADNVRAANGLSASVGVADRLTRANLGNGERQNGNRSDEVQGTKQIMAGFLNRIIRCPPKYVGDLLSPDQFRKVLERERMRADRASTPLSLLVIMPPPCRQQPQSTSELAAMLASRLRATDVAGQLEDGRVGALLLNTPEPEAWCVADDVKQAFAETKDQWHCEVYGHPFPPLILSDTRRQEPTAGGGDRDPAKPLGHVLLKPLPWWKRALDIVGASAGLLLLSPLIVGAAVLIKLTSTGPVLFKQVRSGLGGKPFTIYKFRTMCVDAEAQKQSLQSQNEQDGPAFKIKKDPRVTTIGRYLRVTCVDELPQLWNILVGDMTLVGPRPLPVDEAERCQDWEQRRLDVTPGLTCIWQAAGRRERISFADWMRMDLRYIKGRSVRKDLALLWRTFVNVISHRGSH